MTFPGDRVAQFTVSYAAAAIDTLTVYGTDAYLTLDPAYGMGKPKTYALVAKGKPVTDTYKPTDHFGGECRAFSDHILQSTDPEPDGEEGLLDVRVIEAAVESMKTGRPVALAPVERRRRIDPEQVESLRPVSPPELIGAKKPAKK